MVEKLVNQEIDWHFPRRALAEKYLSVLASGLTSSTVLFAPRRKGKTEFALFDLMPLAKEMGFRPVYCSMWLNRENPAGALVQTLYREAEPKTVPERVKATLNQPLKSAKINLDVPAIGKLEASGEFDNHVAAAGSAMALSDAMDAVIKAAGRGRVLLVLDEIQHLGKPEFKDFVATLRTVLDERKEKVKVVFTGSSRHRLQEMFYAIHAALYQFASQPEDFPEMGRDFTDFLSEQFYKASKRRLPSALTLRAFEVTHHTPGHLKDALVLLLQRGGLDLMRAVHEVVAAAQENSGYKAVVERLPALDREVVFAVVAKVDLYSRATIDAIEQIVGVPPTVRQIQAAVERLEANQILYKRRRGEYQIEDHQLQAYLESILKPHGDAPGDSDEAGPPPKGVN